MDDSPWMPPPPGGEAALPPPPPPEAFSSEPTMIEPSEPASRPRRTKVIVGVAIVAVLAIGAAGVFAVSRFTGETQSGAASPSDLGAELLTAIANEDVLGMTDVLVPGERALFQQPLVDLVSELTRLEILAPNADLENIAGIDIVLENTSVVSRATNVDDIVNVDMRALATATVDGESFPVGDLITDNMDPDDVTDMRGTVETTTEEFDFTLTAVEEDGRWYFSLFHTLAEQMRADIVPDADIPVEGIGADGAESPEEAVNQMLDRIEALDLTGMIRMLNPGEAAALQRYAPLFIDDAQSEVDSAPVELDITNREFRVEGDGDQRTVLFDALTFTAQVDDDTEQGVTVEVSFDDSCMHAALDDETFDICAGSAAETTGLDDALADAPDAKAFIDALGKALDDIEPIGIELRSHDGTWFVSPTATSTEATLAVLRALDRSELDQLIELAEPAADELLDVAFGGLGGYEDDYYEDDYYEDDVSFDDSLWDDSLDDVSFDESIFADFTYDESADQSRDESTLDEFTFDDSFDDVSSVEPAGWERCSQEVDTAAATACFQQYIDSGEIDATFMPVPLRFPECGYADVWWSGELYSLPDAEFIAAVEAAQPCFLALVASGEISDYELPTEITHLQCFEGRNWYNVFDDPEYDDRYYACISATSVSE